MKKLRNIFSKNMLLSLFAVLAMSVVFASCTNDSDEPAVPGTEHHHGGGGSSN